jgi:uroporphyrinogen-III synthase
VACYAVEPEPADSTGDAAKMVEQGADWIVFASGLAIEHFHARFDLPKLMARFPSTRLAIASDSIKWALAGLGLEPAIIATPENVEGLVDLLARAATMGDAKCPLIHPDSVAHRQLPREEREETGVPEHYLPFSIGSDEVEDVKPYVNQALQVPQK